MKPTLEEIYAFEEYLEPAFAALLKTGGLNVVEPFILQADVPQMPEDNCVITFEAAPIDDQVKAFITDAAGQPIDAIAAGFAGDLVVTHQVAMDDQAPPPGQPRGPYQRLRRQRGQIRALVLNAEKDAAFQASLPWISILSINLSPADRRVDVERSVNQATERFAIRFMPRREAL